MDKKTCVKCDRKRMVREEVDIERRLMAGFEPRLLQYCPSFQSMHTNSVS